MKEVFRVNITRQDNSYGIVGFGYKIGNDKFRVRTVKGIFEVNKTSINAIFEKHILLPNW